MTTAKNLSMFDASGLKVTDVIDVNAPKNGDPKPLFSCEAFDTLENPVATLVGASGSNEEEQH